ncbi:hypothetical protein LOAG_00894 [Loa loa]|uniref:Uncharacterized protein n=1 Tax=Loa loa TaxID=7209 RepID=A0A1S0UAD8_LOALO|nr:hypothetical protein LOAG_00894 [Loa loa]EFO27595.1 hypothetical protein LOAG_00894 [Loa loa]
MAALYDGLGKHLPHTHIQTLAHPHMQTETYTYIYIYVCIYTYATHTHTHTHIYICAYKRKCQHLSFKLDQETPQPRQ